MPADSRPCKVCLVQHDDEIHAATLSVHVWFHEQVTQGFYEDIVEQAVPVEAHPVESQVA
jgi:hypothetical protein